MTSPPSLRYPCFHPFLIISYVCLTICLSVSLLKTLPTSSLGYARTPGSATKWPLLKAALYNLLVTLRVCPTNWNVCVPACVCVCVCCTLHVYIHEWTTTPHKMERSGSLVDSSPFVRRVVGSNHALAASYRNLGQVTRSQLPVAIRRQTPKQYPCCVGSASE